MTIEERVTRVENMCAHVAAMVCAEYTADLGARNRHMEAVERTLTEIEHERTSKEG